MRTRPLSLKGTIATLTALMVGLAGVATFGLIGLTALLHNTTEHAAIAVESVRLAQVAEIDLLLHSRTGEPLIRRNLEERMRRRLTEARPLATEGHERRALEAAEAQVAAYIAAARDPATAPADLDARQQDALSALEALVTANIAHARRAHARADWWDEVGNVAGVGLGALLLVATGAVLAWLRRRALAPLVSLAETMERFGKGDRDVRAEQTGPLEVQEMSDRFNEMAGTLSLQRQRQIAFLGGVAHDLRNPLSVLKMSVALASPDKPLPPEPRLRQMIEKIARQIARLDRMTGDFLDTARIENGQLDLKVGLHDAREVVRTVVDLFDDGAPGSRLRVSVPDEPVMLECDPLRIEQVLTNLVSNAIKYSPPETEIEVALEPRPEEVVLRVTDQGIGIPEAEQKTVFEPFRRSGLSMGTVPGVGLGLHVVRQLVAAHRGRIELQSTPGGGSTFRVFLPRRHAPAQEPSSARRG